MAVARIYRSQPLASPVLSADGSTAYVNGRDEHLWAINAADGKPK